MKIVERREEERGNEETKEGERMENMWKDGR